MSEKMFRILVVDDEEHIRELLKFNLEKNKYEVICAEEGNEAVEMAVENKPDLILLDLMLPGIDGYDVCKVIRGKKETANIPVIMITAKGEEFDKILGLELGADDYITKPFSIRELMARVKAVLRRINMKSQEDVFKFGEIEIDFDKHHVTKNGEVLELTLKEYELLNILCKNEGKVMTREYLLDKIWGYEYVGETRTVDVHIRHLRKKIEKDDKSPKFISTVRGIGYRFNFGE